MDYYGGARKLSAWNLYVRAHAHEYKGKKLPAGQMLKELSVRARQEGVIGTSKAIVRSECAQKPYNMSSSLCVTNPSCAWRTPTKLTKKGVARKAFCTKGIRSNRV